MLVLAQAVLGGLTVEHGLHSALVAAHLGLAMLLLGLLITGWTSIAVLAINHPARIATREALIAAGLLPTP